MANYLPNLTLLLFIVEEKEHWLVFFAYNSIELEQDFAFVFFMYVLYFIYLKFYLFFLLVFRKILYVRGNFEMFTLVIFPFDFRKIQFIVKIKIILLICKYMYNFH